MAGRAGPARGCRAAPHDARAGLIGADMEKTMEMRAWGMFVFLLPALSSVGSKGGAQPENIEMPSRLHRVHATL